MQHLNTTILGGTLLAAAVFCTSATASQHALLIGVSDYKDKRIVDLEGPVNDVSALQTVLTKHWGIDDRNITALVDQNATEKNIKSAFKDLETNTKPGDDIIVYFSGHGTSVKDPDFGALLNLPDTSGALVTHDFDAAKHVAKISAGQALGAEDDGLLIGRYEIKPLLQNLSQDKTVLVIFDSCFSGNAVRGNESPYAPKNTRLLNLVLGSESEPAIRTGISGASRCLNCASEQDDSKLFDYENVVYFGAAADNQKAVDLTQAEIDAGQANTFDNKPHGGFSDALLRVLSTKKVSTDNQLSYHQIFNLLVGTFNVNCAHCAHNPVLLPIRDSAALSKSFMSRSSTAPVASALEASEDLFIQTENLKLALSEKLQKINRVSVSTRKIDIKLTAKGDSIEALSASGQLISNLPAHWNEQQIGEWVEAQSWLKHRQRRDAEKSQGHIEATFRSPLTNPVAFAGETVYFNVSLEKPAKLVVLLTNSLGKINVLFPANKAESQHVFESNKTFNFPQGSDFNFSVVEPWGTDQVSFYALPAESHLSESILPLAQMAGFDHKQSALSAFTAGLDATDSTFSAAHVRFHATR